VAGLQARSQGQARARLRRRGRRDGAFRLVTGAGFRHRIDPPAHPASDEWPDLPEIQFSATELIDALTDIRTQRDRDHAEARELEWEHGTLLEQLRL